MTLLKKALFASLISVALLPAHVYACEVPVFSYAMQYWSADPYRVSVFHDGALESADEAFLERFKAVVDHETLETNMELRLVDVSTLTDAIMLELQRAYLKDTLPGVIAQYPISSGIHRPVYAGPPAPGLLSDLVDSPARNTLISKLVSGSTAVWVLLESGNRRDDNAAATILETELRRMEQVLQLPEVSLWAWSDTLRQAAEDGLGVRFPVLRVSRDDPDERMFIQMLLNSEPDLMDMEDAPMAFPVYGRGLILYALVGAGINAWTIADACEFIVGPCSCQVKASNPGTDILLSVNWSGHIGETRYDQVAPLAGFSDFFERGEIAAAQLTENSPTEELVAELLAETDADAQEDVETSYASWVIGGGAAVLALLGLFFYVSYKQTIGKE